MASPLATQINRWIASTHPNAPLAGQGEMLVRAGRKFGVDPRVLAIIARKESEFGTTSGRFRNNAWGWGVHLGPGVNTAPNWQVMAERVAKGLSGSLYKGSGLTRIDQIINRYAPPSENDTGLYIKQISDWYRQMGGNPSASVFGGQQSGGGAPADAGGVPLPAPPASLPSGQLDARRLLQVLRAQTQRSLQGQMPTADFRTELAGLAKDALPRAQAYQGARAVGNQAQQAGQQVAAAPQRGGGLTAPGGGWGGAEAPALAIAKFSGLPITSQKRSRQMTASGNPSDHWTGSTQSYAVDLGTSGSAGDAAFRKIITGLGYPNLQPGRWHNLNIGGYRYQIGWRTPGHFDHIHVGVKKL